MTSYVMKALANQYTDLVYNLELKPAKGYHTLTYSKSMAVQESRSENRGEFVVRRALLRNARYPISHSLTQVWPRRCCGLTCRRGELYLACVVLSKRNILSRGGTVLFSISLWVGWLSATKLVDESYALGLIALGVTGTWGFGS